MNGRALRLQLPSLMYERDGRHSHSGRSLDVRPRVVTRRAVSSLMVISHGAASQVRLSRACGAVPGTVPAYRRSEVGLIRGRASLWRR